MNAKEQIIKAIENCDDEKLAKRMYIRVARRYCAANRISNIVNDDGAVTPPILPDVEEMVKNLDDKRCYQILTSNSFKKYFEEYGEKMKCCECHECAGLDCPVIIQREADDISAYKQMQVMQCEELEDMDSHIIDNDDGETIVVDKREIEGGYLGEPGFSSAGDYWGYILG